MATVALKKWPGAINGAAYVACLAFFVIGAIVSLHRFWQYDVGFVDFGQYDQAIWKVSRFQAPITYHFIYGKINVLGDHVTPSIFLLSPLYWLTDRSEIILIVQALVVAVSGLVLYDLAKRVLADRALALGVLLCYFLFVGLQNAVITEFHELTIMTLPLMLTFWAIVTGKKAWYFVFLLLTLGFKEITFTLGIGIAIALFFLKKDWWRESIFTLLLSVAWGLLAFRVIIPYFTHSTYLYVNNLPAGILPKALALIDEPLKRRTLWYSFLSFSFLPVLAPQFWAAILQDYATRFIPENFVTRWGLGLHYNAQSAVLLAVASVYGVRRLMHVVWIKKYVRVFILLAVLNALFLFRFILHGPFFLAFNSAFYRHTGEFDFLNTMVAKIPKNASVMTQNNLATRFTHQNVRLLDVDYPVAKPDYMLFDVRDGQNPNNYFGTLRFFPIFQQVLRDPNYTVIYQTKDQYIFKRNNAPIPVP